MTKLSKFVDYFFCLFFFLNYVVGALHLAELKTKNDDWTLRFRMEPILFRRNFCRFSSLVILSKGVNKFYVLEVFSVVNDDHFKFVICLFGSDRSEFQTIKHNRNGLRTLFFVYMLNSSAVLVVY